MDANDAEEHFKSGTSLFRSKRYEEAEKEFREALRLNPNYAKAHNNLGRLWFEYNLRSMCDEIGEEYKKAIEINPNYTEAHYNLWVL
ncbi:MAG: tetratricopeptide repeat protein [Candidatus Altiarchaeum hamiconexum]|uniref:Tetratricopeptide repeat protein n=1 Tax=Candidatus Altarchaeum hamiconexum TaxID=1803513 RepID=A0A8J8CL31_9ARCH|nr:tetratricopeptide repeat protein [Candidatus Altarchaeum hamiconexum]PIV28635.1 MAG: hypothetical protein COS36_01520 [Candidatus Altarchaeum sp. CG03_land_8_20_14_0_80_32_618]PJC13465.1 MAG: hypothetical protein CO063_04300 [Candidatus Altarchaeum sp. CG_4_9_14_0_8_um_filter_32_206]NCN68781.1 tetratricopeptide repeat protein [Candidatus Altarchaeum hamiconexum]NCS92087.1 tetratricopeptide repeat protein [Candidatus Altarchaeum hamiconexum]